MSTTLKFKKIFTTSCLLAILSILAVLSIQTLNPQKASAATTSDVMIGSDAPMTGSMINTAAAIARPYFAVGTGTLSSSTDNKYAYAKVYLPIDTTTGKNYKDTVTSKWETGERPGDRER